MNHVNVVAEIGCNHMGDFEITKRMIVAAKACGADYVKMQKRDIGSIPKQVYDRPYDSQHSFGKTYGEHRTALEFDREQWYELAAFAKTNDIGFFATPFDMESALFFLTELYIPIIKMGSTQFHDETMIKLFSTVKHPPLILSTGMADVEHVKRVYDDVRPEVLMQTTSTYPCDESEVNLAVLHKYAEFGCEIGLSGHYVAGNGAIEAAAVAFGATWIERHFTLDRTWKGTDQAASLEPEGFKNVVKAVRTVERAMGSGEKRLFTSEIPVLKKIKA